jgi:hypothetical protein
MHSLFGPIEAGWRPAVLLMIAFQATVVCAMPADEDVVAGVPACMRDVSFWKDRNVIQVFGCVFAEEDKGDVAKRYFWRLGPSAVGKVVEVTPDDCCIVEFGDDTDWHREELPDDLKKRSETKIAYDRDNYGAIQGATITTVTREGIQVPAREWGRIISAEDQRRSVKFPRECLGLPRPRLGDKVTRGPDWRAGHADGGANPVGLIHDNPAQFFGTVVGEHDADYYVLVRWDRTGRECAYRYDKRRFYDVMLLEDAAVGNEEKKR